MLKKSSWLVVGGGMLLLVACGDQNSQKNQVVANSDDLSANRVADTATPAPAITDPVEPPPSPSATPTPTCTLSEPTVCSGPLALTAESVALRWGGPPSGNGRRKIVGTATVVIESNSDEPVRVALLDDQVRLQFSNAFAMSISASANKVTGVPVCGDSGDQCTTSGAQKFATLSRRGEKLRLEIAIDQYVSKDEADIMPNADSATVSASLWVISSIPDGENIALSVKSPSINNLTRQ